MPLFWIIDEEWADYDVERALLREQYPDCEICCSGYDYQADLEAFGCRCDAILTQIYTDLPAATIDRLERCKAIAVYGGGYDRVDIACARKKGILVTNVQGYCAEDLADYTLAAIFRANKPLDQWSKATENGLWGAPAVPHPNKRISASTLMVVGCGRIGSTVAQRAKALGMTVLGYDPQVPPEKMRARGMEPVTFGEGFRRADFVSINVKYQPATHHLITMDAFRLMKPTAVLINTSRGKVIKEADLIAAVQQRLFAGAVVDVIENEPPTGDEPILHCENIAVTPHVSYISQESFRDLKRRTVQNALAILAGGRPDDTVN